LSCPLLKIIYPSHSTCINSAVDTAQLSNQ